METNYDYAVTPGAPEAVLDWGGQRPNGAHDFFSSVGAHQWRSQLFGMGGARVPNVATKN